MCLCNLTDQIPFLNEMQIMNHESDQSHANVDIISRAIGQAAADLDREVKMVELVYQALHELEQIEGDMRSGLLTRFEKKFLDRARILVRQ
jgi:hypothetical protein